MQLRHLWVIGLLGMICLAGCYSLNSEDESRKKDRTAEIEREDEGTGILGMVPDLDYKVPESCPGILVNRTGYLPAGRKKAVFRGEELPDRFEVIDEKTGNVVFSGVVEEKVFDEKTGEYRGYGIFDALAQPGGYYIWAPILGHSYPFHIEKDIYTDTFDLACRQYYFNRCEIGEKSNEHMEVIGGWHTDGEGAKDVVKSGLIIANLLLAYELYPEVFLDESGIPESGNGIPDILDEVKYEIDWLLAMQDEKTGGIYSLIGGPITLEATASVAAVAAKFSYAYATYEAEYAEEYLQAADKAWRYVESERETEEVKQRFFAAAELYRASGYSSYKRAVEGYLAKDIWEEMEDDYIFWGSTTYISTKRSVDITICSNVTKKLMDEAERISQAARESSYLALGSGEPDNNERFLHQMTRLAVTDYIITNHEYEVLIENRLHYFMGCNNQAISYIDGEGDNNTEDIDVIPDIMSQPEQNAKLILIMSGVISQ